MKSQNIIPCVLTVAGSDPCGGAGIQADVKTLTLLKVHAATAITCVTVQNSAGLTSLNPLDPCLVTAQMQAAFQEFAIGHVKLGMLGNVAVARAVCQVLAEHPCQVVADPVLRATAGGGLDDLAEQREIMDLVCDRATVVCPNLPELAALGRGDDMGQQARGRAGASCES